MKEKISRLFVACLSLTLAHHGLAAPAGKGAFAPAQVTGAAAVEDSKQLERFILPEIVIDEPTLEAALNRLKAVYVDVCTQTGETPLPISFVVSGAVRHPVKAKRLSGDVHKSVLLLASLHGMRGELHGSEYRFSPMVGDEKFTKTLQVAPDFSSQLQEMAMTGKRQPVAKLLLDLGLVSDPGAAITLRSSGELVMTDVRSAEVQAISQFCGAFYSIPKQIRFTLKVVELAKGMEVTVPKEEFLTEKQALDFEQAVSKKAGANLSTLPSVTNRSAEMSTIEIVREFPSADNLREGQKSVVVGKVAKMQGSLTGSKLDVTFDYSDTSGSLSPVTEKVVVDQYAKFAGKEYFPDGSTKVFTQSRPDGSKTLLLVKADVIDATGRLARESL